MVRILAAIGVLMWFSQPATAAERVTLVESNFDQYVPAGKEVDAIYGDIVLKSDKLVAVIAAAEPTRNANMTVKRVGGCVIDLTRLDHESDQLSCFYPHAGDWELVEEVDSPKSFVLTNKQMKTAWLTLRFEPSQLLVATSPTRRSKSPSAMNSLMVPTT